MWFTREGIFHGVDEIDGVGGDAGDAQGRAPDAERRRRALSARRSGRWVFRYAREGRKHDMGLGPAIDVSLAEARTKAQEARRLLIEGKDPLDSSTGISGREREACDLRQGRRGLHRGARCELDPQARRPMAAHLGAIGVVDDRRNGCCRGRSIRGLGRADADMDHNAGHRVSSAQPCRTDHRCRQGAGLEETGCHEQLRERDRELLTALAYARGTGLDAPAWLAFAAALGYSASVADLDALRLFSGR